MTPTQNLITLSKETQLHWRPSLSAYSTLPSTKSFGEGKGNPLQYSCLENPMDRGAWKAAVHGVAKSRARLSLFTFTFHFHALEKEMATHSNILAWRIPGTEEPNGLPSMVSHRVGHDWRDLAATAAVPEVGWKVLLSYGLGISFLDLKKPLNSFRKTNASCLPGNVLSNGE